MQVGDLVTLSTYALNSEPMWSLKQKVLKHKKPLIGLVVRVQDNPHTHSWTSKNEKTFFYIQWMQEYGPASRWSMRNTLYRGKRGYFLRKDLKFVRG
jgi:hypothetical protein